MGRKNRPRLRALRDLLSRAHPQLDVDTLIVTGRVTVDGLVVRNPRSLVRDGASIALRDEQPLRGEAKLRCALAAWPVAVAGRTAVDVGAAAGGFTRALLDAGAARVYAVDAGHGQLLGSLRQHERVVNLERTNLGALSPELVPETVGVVTIDLSYLSIVAAAPQLERVAIAEDAELVALVKPAFELALAEPPTSDRTLAAAVEHASAGLECTGWAVEDVMDSPPGAGGAVEFLLWARRRATRRRR